MGPRWLLSILWAVTSCAHPTFGAANGPSSSARADRVHVEIRGADGDAAVAEQVHRVLPAAIEAAERWAPLHAGVVVTIHGSHQGLEAAAQRIGQPWMRAWARPRSVELQSPRTWSKPPGDDAVRRILAHELAHCVLFQATGPGWQEEAIPLWFLEGMASVAAGEDHSRADASALEASDSQMRSDSSLVYDTADWAFRQMLTGHGEDGVRAILAGVRAGRPFPEAFRAATGATLADFEADARRRMAALASSR